MPRRRVLIPASELALVALAGDRHALALDPGRRGTVAEAAVQWIAEHSADEPDRRHDEIVEHTENDAAVELADHHRPAHPLRLHRAERAREEQPRHHEECGEAAED